MESKDLPADQPAPKHLSKNTILSSSYRMVPEPEPLHGRGQKPQGTHDTVEIKVLKVPCESRDDAGKEGRRDGVRKRTRK